MVVAILAGVLLCTCLGAALAGWRAKQLQSSDTFAPSDHVEVERRWNRRASGAVEVHHDDDPEAFHLGD